MSRENLTILDTVVMGDLNVGNSNCPSCKAANVKILRCQSNNCVNVFCEICGTNSRVASSLVTKEFTLFRFDSGEGMGPFCKSCLHKMEQDFEQEMEEQQRQIARDIQMQLSLEQAFEEGEEQRRIERELQRAGELKQKAVEEKAAKDSIAIFLLAEKNILYQRHQELEDNRPSHLVENLQLITILLSTLAISLLLLIIILNHASNNPEADLSKSFEDWTAVDYLELIIVVVITFSVISVVVFFGVCIVVLPTTSILFRKSFAKIKQYDESLSLIQDDSEILYSKMRNNFYRPDGEAPAGWSVEQWQDYVDWFRSISQ